MMNSTIYKQYDSRWGSKPYPIKSSSFSGNGCGCVAVTHLLIEQDKYKKYTPEPVRKYMVSQGFAVPNQGTTWSGITKSLEHYGFKVTHVGASEPMSTVWKELDKGNRIGIILFSGGAGPDGTVWTAGGHYMAFTAYKKTNSLHKLYMKDSGARNHDGWYSYEKSMKGRVYQVWIVENFSASSKSTDDDFLTAKNIKAAQKLLGTTADGIISGQLSASAKYWPGIDLSCVEFGSGGSAFIKALQKKLKMSGPDGYLGPNTIKAVQKLVGVKADGYWGPKTTKAFNDWVAKSSKPKSSTTDNKSTSKSTKLKGIDISNYQGKISQANFKKIKDSGVKFVILRIGYTGSSTKEPTIDVSFENNYKNAIAVGLPVGIYYYSLATTEAAAKKEANFVVKHLRGKKITYPVYIDIEDSKQMNSTKSALAKVANTFCGIVAGSGYKGGVYASLSWLTSKIGKINSKYSIWVAQYYSKCEYTGTYDIWQYSSSGSVPGIKGNVDMNYCYKKFGE